jgi:hypothetical protein
LELLGESGLDNRLVGDRPGKVHGLVGQLEN